MLRAEKNLLMWPNQINQLSNFNTLYLQAKYFPYLFPYAHGDVIIKDRPRAVNLIYTTKHLLWKCVNLGNRRFCIHLLRMKDGCIGLKVLVNVIDFKLSRIYILLEHHNM